MTEKPSADGARVEQRLAFADTAVLEKTLAAHDISLDTLPRETVGRRPPDSLGASQGMLEQLPGVRVTRDAPAGVGADYVIAQELGGGGMGVVELAAQVALDRDVAVKRVRSPDAEQEVLSLLHEARITGCLEHPNVVPVHTIGVDPSHGPLVVMKCVHGIAWDELIAAGDTPMDRHLEILMQVCNAVAFAHSKGIVHCDLKPANVMVGEFGAVYLVDWGIALRRDAPGNDGPRGTPIYMAPEQVAGVAAGIDERTDVYLLGACLHEILTGEGRHDGEDLVTLLRAAASSEPAVYGGDVPAELAAVCNRACHVAPDERYPSAASFREALQEFLDERSARELIAEASQRLDALTAAIERALASKADDNDDDDDDDDDDRVRALFRECQFAFEHVRKTRPGLREADKGLERCLGAMFDYEVALGNRRAAHALLNAMPNAPERARGALKHLHEAQKLERRRLAAMRHATDSNVAAVERSRLSRAFVVVGAVLLAALLLLNHDLQTSFSPKGLLVLAVLLWVIVMTGIITFRRQLFANDYSRRRIQLPIALATGLVANRTIALLLDLSVEPILALDQVVLAMITFTAGPMSRTYYLAAAGMFTGAGMIAWKPELGRMVVNLTLLGLTFLVWSQWRRAKAPDSDAPTKPG
jgi:serine/threonine-protein kinase